MSWTLVTGGGRGIGASICTSLAKEGHHLAIHYHHSEREADEVAAACRVLGVEAEVIQGDFDTPGSVCHFAQEVAQRFPKLSAWVNNVGAYHQSRLQESSWEEVERLFQSNLFAIMQMQPYLLPLLLEQCGAMVNLGVAGIHPLRCDRRSPVYRMAKLALWGYTRSLAREVAPHGVRINMVSPGQTESSVELEEQSARLPMNRAAYLGEVAEAVAFLLSSKGRYITGQNLEVSGGYAL